MAKKKAAKTRATSKAAPRKKATRKKAPAKKAAPKKSRPSRTAANMTTDQYARHKARAGANQSQKSRDGRDLCEKHPDTGEWIPLPDIADLERWERCRFNLLEFLPTYFPDLFDKEFSPDHIELIEAIEHNILHGGLEAFALPRGSGKSTISECAVVWALAYGHRRFIALIGSTAEAAKESLDAIKVAIETNDLLIADFPLMCLPVVALEGINNRCRGQLHQGVRTRISWKDNGIVLPSIDGSDSSGGVIKARGITGRIRGMKHALPDGTSIRPDFVMIDDPQTEESAASEKENRKRIKVLKKAIIGLAGPGKRIAGIMPCTVIEPLDMADIILDRNKHPEWNGRRVAGLKSFPTNMKLWEEYQELRDECFRNGDKKAEAATKFYRKNREAMDAGGEPYWEARFDDHEISALQNLMNWFLTDPEGFAAEVQQQPERSDIDDADLPTEEEITHKQHLQGRDVVPMDADRITAMIDVGEKLLWFIVIAWRPDFTGYVLRYGVWPDQGSMRFSKLKPRKTLVAHYTKGKRKPSIDAATRRGLDDLKEHLCAAQFVHESGMAMQIGRLLVDAGDRDVLIKRAIREWADPRVWASFGRTPKIGGKKIHEGPKKQGDGTRIGEYWRSQIDHKAKIRYVTFDANWWKAKVHKALSTGFDERGSLSLYGDQPHRHEKYAQHLLAETRQKIEVNGEESFVYDGGGENDWLDCTVGAMVAASIAGCSTWSAARNTPGKGKGRKPRRKRKAVPL